MGCDVPVTNLNGNRLLDFGIVVFEADISDKNTNGNTDVYASKTVIHETGHLLGVGRHDDGSVGGVVPVEVCSGSDEDDTPEEVGYAGDESAQWSVMSSGWKDPVNNQPMDGNYIAFSIEELFTIEFNEI